MLKNQRAIANSSLFGSLFNFDFKNLFVLSMLSSVVNKNGKPNNRIGTITSTNKSITKYKEE